MGRSVRKCGKHDRGPHPQMIPHDQSYKAMFSHPRVVEDLVRGFVAELLEGGEEWVERLDFSTLEPLPTERIDSNLRSRSNDLVWRVGFRDAEDGPEWLHVVLMLEFQSSVDWGMALRVQGYAVRLFESLWQERRPGREDRLPAVLAVVVYNGRVAWRAPQALADLIGKDTRPQAAAKASRPKFSGERYELIDIGAYELKGLPEGNVVSLVVAAERMSGPGEATAVLERALRLLSAAEREKLRKTFLKWFRLLVARTGVDLDILEDSEMLERIEESGALRTTLEQRFQALRDADVARGEKRGLARGEKRGLARGEKRGLARGEKRGLVRGERRGLAQGLAQGLERERQLLVRQVGRKFGPDVADLAAGLLAGTSDPDRLLDVGEWILDCHTGSELLARLREIG